jgi:hypothetical protein
LPDLVWIDRCGRRSNGRLHKLFGEFLVFVYHCFDRIVIHFDRDRVIARVGFHPILVIGPPPAQRLLADLGDADDVAEEVDDQLGPRQRRQIADEPEPR